jgi:hypothetical protein
MRARTPYGSLLAAKVALAAGVPGGSLLRRVGAYVVPVWDYVLMTEPLSAALLASLGWRDRRGASDLGNQFHYFRLTRDNRVLWGGYDAVYYNGGRIREEHVVRPATFAKLAAQFFATFPQLEGVSFTHAWGVRGRVHGARRRRLQVRRPGAARQAARRGLRTGAADPGQQQAIALPAGAAALRRHPGHPRVDRPCRQERGAQRPVAAHA